MKVNTCDKEVKGFGVLLMVAAALVVASCSGCVPAVLGIKKIVSGDTTVEFITGADVTVGMNGVDTVDNTRGIAPEGGIVSKRGNSAAPSPRKY